MKIGTLHFDSKKGEGRVDIAGNGLPTLDPMTQLDVLKDCVFELRMMYLALHTLSFPDKKLKYGEWHEHK
jgi:hypothetical protein